MKKTVIWTFSLAALVGMVTISAKTVRAEAGTSLEGAKQESGVEFGEVAAKHGGSSAVRASGDDGSRPVLTVGKLDMQGRPEVPSPARAFNNNSGDSGRIKSSRDALIVGLFAAPVAIFGAVFAVGAALLAPQIGGAVIGLVACIGAVFGVLVSATIHGTLVGAGPTKT